MRATFRKSTVVVAVALLAGCGTVSPTPVPSPRVTPTSVPSPTVAPTPTPPVPFPLAVVTGITNLKSTVTMHELITLASHGELVLPCGVQV
ncbi:MAG: hypothetical protein A2V85_14035 [Chloroflexi bacterium RBG_16_72_14]|nr:MAG: hypothetical protein A2V85_14035 [Chloroflexi bacterium RBG_16_72_14]